MTYIYKKSYTRTALLAATMFTLAGVIAPLSIGAAIAAEEAQAPAAPQAMPVESVVIKPQTLQIWKNFSGHIVAVDYAEIRPQVSGRITDIRFDDGQSVKKGDVLVVIDPRPYQASVNQAKAALEAAQTQFHLAEIEYQRAKKLIDREAISQGLFDERNNSREIAQATVEGAKAMLESAKINLDYAYVKAPISGKISRAEITIGNVVQNGPNAPLLTSVVAQDQVYVDFEVDERTYLKSVRLNPASTPADIPVRLSLSEGAMEYSGFIHSFDNRIDQATGTIRARAVFDNDNGVLLPGMSLSVLMGSAGEEQKILVTERAIGTDQDRKFVYVITDGAATYREVTLGESIEGRRVILSGLNPGDTVITDGLVRIRPGAPVTPKTAATESAEPLVVQDITAPDISEDTQEDMGDKDAESNTGPNAGKE